MTIYTTSKSVNKFFVAIALVATLASCGGGGGPKKDSTPDSFTITPITNAAVATEVTSAPVTVTGFNQSVAVSISGGTYSIGGGAYTNSAGTITNGQVVTVKVTTSDKTNTAVTATLTVGGVSGQFSATTIPDTTPTAFIFTAATGVGAKSVNTSNEITVVGIDIAVPISITSGEYSINGGAYTSTAGTVSKDQKVTVRATASDKPATKVTAALTIGTITGNYEVTTYADSVAPTAQILFPPPVSMTEGNTILVRGSASDEFSAITSVKVNGVAVTPKATGDFSSWQVSVPLTATTDNNVVVTTEDSVGNKSTNAAKVVVRQGDHKNAFPSEDIAFDGPWAVVFDKLDGHNRLLVSDASNDNIVAIDLITGNRSVFAGSVKTDALTIDARTKRLYGVDDEQLIYFGLSDAVRQDVVFFDSYPNILSLLTDDSYSTSRVLGVGKSNNQFLSHEVSSASFSVFSDAATGLPNSDNPFISSYGATFDKKNNRYLVNNGGQNVDISKHAVVAVDRLTGARTILSSNTVGTGDLFTATLPNANRNFLSGIAVDEKNNRAIVSEALTGTFFTIDLANGNRKMFSDSTSLDAINPIRFVTSLVLADSSEYLLAVDQDQHGVFAVDIITGQRVVFSKSSSEF